MRLRLYMCRWFVYMYRQPANLLCVPDRSNRYKQTALFSKRKQTAHNWPWQIATFAFKWIDQRTVSPKRRKKNAAHLIRTISKDNPISFGPFSRWRNKRGKERGFKCNFQKLIKWMTKRAPFFLCFRVTVLILLINNPNKCDLLMFCINCRTTIFFLLGKNPMFKATCDKYTRTNLL